MIRDVDATDDADDDTGHNCPNDNPNKPETTKDEVLDTTWAQLDTRTIQLGQS